MEKLLDVVEIGAAMFFSLNPLLVMIMTPLLLARWKRQAEQGQRDFRPTDGERQGRRPEIDEQQHQRQHYAQHAGQIGLVLALRRQLG